MSSNPQRQLEPEFDKDLLEQARVAWCDDAKLHVIEFLSGGYSGAAVLLVDLERDRSNSSLAQEELRGGFYVLKLDRNRPREGANADEAQRHTEANAWAPKFCEEYVPKLARSFRSRERIALLYNVAGNSFTRLARADLLGVGPLEMRIRKLSYKLLNDFNSGQTIARDCSLDRLFTDWLGQRLDPATGPKLHVLASSIVGERRSFVRARRILANPLKLARFGIGTGSQKAAFFGMLHGDLHRENIFWEGIPESDRFWLIDFAMSRPGPLLFDQAYLEFSLLLQKFEHHDPARLLNLLDCLLQPANQLGARFVSQEDYGILAITRGIRDGIDEWQRIEQELRADAVREQWCLARVAAGLNWANKPLEEGARHLGFFYAAHAAREYLEIFHSKEWLAWSTDSESSGASAPELSSIVARTDEAWQKLWSEMGGFDPEDGYYVLVSGKLPAAEAIASFGFLPWSAVIDFHVDSDADGLLALTRRNLEQQRALQIFGRTVVSINFARGTAWMLAGGSTMLNEPPLETLPEWRKQFKSAIRQIAAELRSASAPTPVRILILPGEPESHDRMKRALEEIVDELGPELRVVAVTACAPETWNLPELGINLVIDLPVEEVALRTAAVFGVAAARQTAMVPGKDGPIELDVEKIRNFEEDFEVLHSNILERSAFEEADDAFWRGSPPSWRDIETDTPVHRDLEKKLLTEIRAKLKDNRALKLELFHTPGAGGTTLSLMAGWSLRRSVPTAVLRRHSRHTADRVSWLFHLAGLPVLLIADSAVLSRTEADDVLRRLANENARVVLLHVVRVAHPIEAALGLFDPMQYREADLFRGAFAARTTDSHKRVLLGRIARETDRENEALRSAFFFGLVTFEEHFTHLRSYVEVHLSGITFAGRKLLSYLSLVARFSQATLSSPLVRKLLGLDPTAHRPLAEVIGHEPARLVLEWTGKIKLIHPLVAEEILRQIGGDNWKHGLSDICVDFVRHVIAASGGQTDEVYNLFFHLFIEREEWAYDETGPQRGQFSPLLESIPSDAGQRRVLELLTELCPDEPHYWNHLGRHYVYSQPPNYRKAEECLVKAVELSQGKDALHHHALGLVRRFWIQQKIRDMRVKADLDASKLSPQYILDEIGILADSAFSSFEQSRKLRPDVNHGYITHVQTILFVAEALNRNGGEDFTALNKQTGTVSAWLRRQIAVAEELLARLAHFRGSEPETSYEIGCITRLAKLYGRYELIETWENMLGRTNEPLHLRRALAGLYFARRGRNWASLLPKELRRIVDLTEGNLRSDPTDERDIRMWFQAMRRLPEFNYFEAIDRLEAWASRTNSLDAHFYLYVLNYLRWRGEGDDAEKMVQENLEACARGRLGARGYSFEWLANDPEWCQVVQASELGEWDRQQGFFRETRRLAYATGTIESIRPQAGTIRLGRVLRAFFVPPADIREASHLNATVHFHLGFSYEGFRAWSVRLGAPPARKHEIAEPQRLWVGGVPHRFRDEDVRALFQSYGEVTNIELPQDPLLGGNRGFALVTMKGKNDAVAAIIALNNKTMEGGRRLQVREEIPKSLKH